MARSNEEVKTSKAGLIAHIIGALAFLAVGICFFVIDASIIAKVVYSYSVLAIGILFIVFGAYYMIKYFFNHEYTKVSNYGFTMGVILVIIGAIFIFKATLIATFIDALVCIVGAIFGAVMFQQSFALFHMQRGSWFINLLFGVATVAASIYMLLNPFKFFEGDMIPTVYLIAVGGVSLFALILMAVGLRDHKKDSNRVYNRNTDDSAVAVDESIFEEEPVFDIPEETVEAPEAGSDALFEE